MGCESSNKQRLPSLETKRGGEADSDEAEQRENGDRYAERDDRKHTNRQNVKGEQDCGCKLDVANHQLLEMRRELLIGHGINVGRTAEENKMVIASTTSLIANSSNKRLKIDLMVAGHGTNVLLVLYKRRERR